MKRSIILFALSDEDGFISYGLDYGGKTDWFDAFTRVPRKG